MSRWADELEFMSDLEARLDEALAGKDTDARLVLESLHMVIRHRVDRLLKRLTSDGLSDEEGEDDETVDAGVHQG